MNAEESLAAYICNTSFEDLSIDAVETVGNMVRADIGTIIAGAHADGCEALVDEFRRQGGAAESTLLIHGAVVPAQHAAFGNAVMSRALDFCDAIAPGPHIGSSIIPVALACSEIRGGCNGHEFMTALAIGAEVAARFNLSESAYDGFDPTGICVPFGAAAVASRLLGLDKGETLNALGIVFNRCGGSFQSNIDGTLSVRFNQGWVAGDAVSSARLAKLGITGPQNFLSGIYGYLHLYGKGEFTAEDIVGGLGREDRLTQMMYKKYPSCGATQGLTDVMLELVRDAGLVSADIESVRVSLGPYGYRLVGHDFKIGDNPTVNAQFSAQYCIANVLLRGGSAIRDFEADSVRDPAIEKYLPMIEVVADPALDERGHTALDLTVRTRQGRTVERCIDIAPGFPGNPLSTDDHVRRFEACGEYARDWFDEDRAVAVLSAIEGLESSTDIRHLIAMLS